MVEVSQGIWDQLVSAHVEADAKAQAAWVTYDALPLPANEQGESPEEQAYEALRKEADRIEEQILGLVAPDARAAAYQLELFALRYHSADLSQPQVSASGPEEAILRRIYTALIA